MLRMYDEPPTAIGHDKLRSPRPATSLNRTYIAPSIGWLLVCIRQGKSPCLYVMLLLSSSSIGRIRDTIGKVGRIRQTPWVRTVYPQTLPRNPSTLQGSEVHDKLGRPPGPQKAPHPQPYCSSVGEAADSAHDDPYNGATVGGRRCTRTEHTNS